VSDEHCVDQDALSRAVCEFISTGKLREPASRAKVVTFNDLGDLTPEYLLEICAYIDKQYEDEGNPVSAVMIKTHLKSGDRVHPLLNGSDENGLPPLDFVDVPEKIIVKAMKQMLGFSWGKVGRMGPTPCLPHASNLASQRVPTPPNASHHPCIAPARSLTSVYAQGQVDGQGRRQA